MSPSAPSPRARLLRPSLLPLLLLAACGGSAVVGAPPVDPASSTVTPDATADIPANGVAAVGVAVVVRDADGLPLAGHTVALALSGSDNLITQPTAPTGPDGLASGVVRTTVAGAKTLTVTVDPGPNAVLLTDSPTLTFVGDAATIDPDLSTANAAPASSVLADGLTTALLTVTVRDALGNPVPGRVVQLDVDGAGNTLTQPFSVTGADGRATGQLASTTAELKNVSVTVDPGPGAVVLTNGPVVGFIGDPTTLDATLSTLDVSPATGLVADGVTAAVVTVTARDANGNPVAGQGVTLSASGADNSLTQPLALTDANGRTVGTLASTTAEVKLVGATLNTGASQVVLVETEPVAFVGDPAALSAVLSTVAVSPGTDLVADGTESATLAITVRDVNGNPVPGLAVQLAATGSDNTLTQPAQPTDAAGQVVGTLASSRAETKTVSIVVDPAGSAVTLAASPAIVFVGDPANLSASATELVATPDTNLLADGVATATVTATVRDVNGNPVAGRTVQLSANGSGNTLVQPPTVTDASGVASGSLASTVAESKTLTATLDPGPGAVAVTASPTVAFVADASSLSATLSGAATAPATGVVADGAALSTLTVTVRDAQGNPVPGRTVAFAASGSGNTLTQPVSVTDASGTVTAQLASTKAETKSLTITVDPGAGAVVLTTTPTVEFVADASNLSALLSLASATPNAGVIADDSESSTVSVVVKDVHGNVVPGQTVQLAVSGTANTILQPAAVTDSAGSTAGALTSTKAELKQVTVTVNPGASQVVLSQTPTVEFLGDPSTISATGSLTSAVPATGVVADDVETTTITTLVRDANGNAVAGQTVFYASDGSGNNLVQPATTTDANGVASGTLASSVAETKTITVVVNPGPTPVQLTQEPTVVFVPDDTLSASLSTAVGAPISNVVADGVDTSTLTVTVRDGLGNVVPGVDVLLSVTGTNNTLTQPVGPTDGSGVATATLSSTTAETKALTIVVDPGPDQVVLDASPSVVFIADASSLNDTLSTATAAPETGLVADGAATSTVTITVLDDHGNPVPGQTVSLASSGSGNTLVQPGTTDTSGVATGTLATTVAETKTLTVTLNPGGGQVVLVGQPTVEFLPDAISASLSSAAAVASSNVVADGATTATVTVTVLDTLGNPVPGQTVSLAATGTGNTLTQPAAVTDASGVATGTLASTVAETKSLTITVNPGGGAVVLDDTPTVGFIADVSTIHATLSTTAALPATGVVADGATTSTVTVTVRDANGNPVPGQTVSLASTGTENTLVQPGVTDAAGTTAGTLATTEAEAKTVTVTINPGGGQVVLVDTPTVAFVGDPANLSASLSSAATSPATNVVADGVTLSAVTVTVRDVLGNPVAGQTVQLAATGTDNTLAQPPSTTDASGVATATLASTKAETKTLALTVNPGGGQVVLDATPTVQFVADAANVNASLSTVSASPATGLAADGVESSTVTVVVLDTYGNPVAGQTVTLAATGTGNTLTQPVAVTDAAGTTTGSLAATDAETKTVTATVAPGAGQTVLAQTAVVEFLADVDNVSDTLTTVVASPSNGVIADGVESSTVTVTVRDVNGNPVPGLAVQLAATGADNTLTQPAAVTDAGGVATGTLATTHADIVVVTATVEPGPSQVVAIQTPTVEFVGDPSDVSAALSLAFSVPASGVVADGAEASTVYAFVRDANDNPVPGLTVQLSASGTGNTLTQPAVATDASGMVTGTLTSTTAETKTLTITVDPGPDQVVLDATPTATFVADASQLDDTLSTVVVSPATGVVADGAATSAITVTVRDANGNPVAGATVQLATDGSNNTLVQPAAVTDASGVATGTLATTTAETKTITVTVDPGGADVDLVQQPTVVFEGDPDALSASLSSLTASALTGIAADGAETTTITVTLRDTNGNPVPGRTVQLSATGTGNSLAQPSGTTDAAGQATGTLASSASELKTVRVTVDPGAGEVVLDDTLAISFSWSLGNTYYVRLSGTDPGDCSGGTSPATAWRTLGKASACASAGDTIHVGAGTYAEALVIATSGAPGNPLRFLADTQGVYTGDAGEVAIDGGGADAAVHFDGADDVEFVGFTVTGGSGSSVPAGGLLVEGDDVVLRGNTVYGNSWGITVHDATGALLEENRVSNNLGVEADGVLLDNADDTVLRGNLVYNNGDHGVYVQGTSTGLLFESNTFYGNGEDGLKLDGSGNSGTLRNTLSTHNADDGLHLLGGSTLTTEYNAFFGNSDQQVQGLTLGTGDITTDPLYVDVDGADDLLGGAEGADDSFHLDHGSASPALDVGSAAATALAFGDGSSLADRTSRTDGVLDGSGADGATANLGFHYPASTTSPTELEASDVRIALGTSSECQLDVHAYDDSAGTLDSAASGPPVGATVRWVRAARTPLDTTEELLFALADDGAGTTLRLLRWTGSAWLTDFTETGIATGDARRRGFDVVYEATTGQALAVYSDGTDTPVARTFANGEWSAAASLPLNDGGGANPDPNTGVVQWVQLVARPGDDEVALVYSDANDDLVAIVWDGTQWLTATADTLESALEANPVSGEVDNRAFDVAYEASSGDLLAAWARSGSNGFWWSAKAAAGSTWSTAAAVADAPTGGTPHRVDLASEPGSERIAAGLFDLGGGTERLGLATWNGSTWIDAVELDSQIRDVNDTAGGDAQGSVAWVGTSGQALCVYADDNTGALDWATWSASSGWELRTDVAIAGKGETESTLLVPEALTGALFALVADDAGDLYALTYDGVTWTLRNGGAALETELSATDSVPFGAARAE